MKLSRVLLASLPFCGLAEASIVSVGIDLVQIAQPADATLDTLISAPNIYCWNESQGVTLGASVHANARLPGTYLQPTDLVSISIPAGFVVDSHYIHFDAFGTGARHGHGQITFAAPILGVICDNAPALRDIDNSDFLVRPTLFTHAEDARGMELSPNSDRFTISADHLSLDFFMDISVPGDYIRVITAHAAPTPGAGLVLGLGGLAGGVRRRRATSVGGRI